MNIKARGSVQILVTLALSFILIGGIGFWIYKNRQVRIIPDQNVSPQPTLNVDETENWKAHSSQKFGYSFKYPSDWDFLAYQEENPEVKFGSHSLANYSSIEVEKHMDHGIIDWKKFLENKPAVKIDFAVFSEKLNDIGTKEEYVETYFANNSRLVKKSELQIGNLDTKQYQATENLGPTDVPEINYFIAFPSEDKLIYVNLYFWNIDSYEALKKTNDWKTLEKILSTFKFTDEKDDKPEVTVPKPNSKVTSPLLVSGKVPLGWMFEGQFPIQLLDSNKNIISEGIGKETVSGSWTSGKPVDFQATITFSTTSNSGYLVLKNDNPSDLPENSKSFDIPVTF